MKQSTWQPMRQVSCAATLSRCVRTLAAGAARLLLWVGAVWGVFPVCLCGWVGVCGGVRLAANALRSISSSLNSCALLHHVCFPLLWQALMLCCSAGNGDNAGLHYFLSSVTWQQQQQQWWQWRLLASCWAARPSAQLHQQQQQRHSGGSSGNMSNSSASCAVSSTRQKPGVT